MAERLLAYVPGGEATRTQVMRQAAGPADSSPPNAGLIWDRYLPIWTPSGERSELRKPLEAFVKMFNDRVKAQPEYLNEQLARHIRALEQLAKQPEIRLGTVECQFSWRFVTGTGADHPTENGFTFHRTTGLPVIPGSSIKGLCRAAAGLEGMSESETERLFGPAEISSSRPGFRGALSFFEAIPKRPPGLCVDVINCHHPRYYQQGGSEPTETESPVPVFFVAVDEGARFVFSYLARQQADLETAERLLRLGLEWIGIGAKTAAGYGAGVIGG
ncbi:MULTISPECIES: type III-B CRISPR module RAMP protein Cmr6 [unclassified Bradyrhizobium]|uniref:type III-B CRISPR module RAMP protein Cmr6 n=1 Tax=unclassified Bradyrhizobium TaxID=2631580 RepID=UPI0028E5DE90|nr:MULTISPECIES: type III-B CRISPR module RAMP protein Cmr6 [unclassified Bradyrhizobium]